MEGAARSLADLLVLLFLGTVCRCSEDERAWMVWGSADAAEVFWTASSCETVTVSQPAQPEDSADAAGVSSRSSGVGTGIRALFFHTATHELIWLQGTGLFRAWMDRTGERRLADLADWQDNATPASTGGSIAVYNGDADAREPALLFLTGMSGGDILAAELRSIPPRWPQDLGMWTRTLSTSAEDAPTVLVYNRWLFWTDGRNLRRARISALLAATAKEDDSAVDSEELLPAVGAFTVTSGTIFWISQPDGGPVQLESTPMQHVESYNYSNHTTTLHRFHEQEVPKAFAVPTISAFGMSSDTKSRHLYWAVAAPQLRARLQRFKLLDGAVEDLCWTGGLERRGDVPVWPSAMAVYMMPKVCTSVACLYMRVFDSCGKNCAEDVCQTCFLDTENWLIKIWMPRYARFNNCVWLFPPDEAAWIVRQEIEAAKKQGLLPDNFTEIVLAPPLTAPPTTTTTTTTTSTPVSITTVTLQTAATTTSVSSSMASLTTVTTVTLTSTATVTSFSNLGERVDSSSRASTASSTTMPHGMTSPTGMLNISKICSSAIQDWCMMQVEEPVQLPLFAPSEVRSNCSQPWSYEALCSWHLVNIPCTQQSMKQDRESSDDWKASPVWMYVAFGAAVMMALLALIVTLQTHDCARRYYDVSSMGSDTNALRRAALAVDSTESKANHLAWSSDTFPELHQYPKGPCHCLRRLFRPARKRMHIAALPKQEKIGEVDESLPNPSSDEPAAAETPCSRTELPRSPQPALMLLPEEWQPSPGKAAAVAAAAGPLTQAMRRTMRSGATEEFRWQCVEDVEDILRVLASQLPREIQEAAWAWHKRQVSRLELWSDVVAAREEATMLADEVSSDLDRRLRAGLQEAEAAAIVAALADLEDAGHPPSNETQLSAQLEEALSRVAEFQKALEQLRCRLRAGEADATSPQQELLAAGQLLAGQAELQRLQQMHQDGLAECEGHLQALPEALASGGEEAHDEAASWRELAARWGQLRRELDRSAAETDRACRDSRILTLAALQHQTPAASHTTPDASSCTGAAALQERLRQQLSEAAQRLDYFQDEVKRLQMRLQSRRPGNADHTDPLAWGEMLRDDAYFRELERRHQEALREYKQALAEAEREGEAEKSRAWRWFVDRWKSCKQDLSGLSRLLLRVHGQPISDSNGTRAEHEKGLADTAGSGSSAAPVITEEASAVRGADGTMLAGGSNASKRGPGLGQLRSSRSANRLSSYGEGRRTSLVSESLPNTGQQDVAGGVLLPSLGLREDLHSSPALDDLMTFGDSGQSKGGPSNGQRRRSAPASGLLSYTENRPTYIVSEQCSNTELLDNAFSISPAAPMSGEEAHASRAPDYLTKPWEFDESTVEPNTGRRRNPESASNLAAHAEGDRTSLVSESGANTGLLGTAGSSSSEWPLSLHDLPSSETRDHSMGSRSYTGKGQTSLVRESPNAWQRDTAVSTLSGSQVVEEESNSSRAQPADHMMDRRSKNQTTYGKQKSSRSADNLLLSYAERRRSSLASDSVSKDGHPDADGSGLSAAQGVTQESHVCPMVDTLVDSGSNDQSAHGRKTGQRKSSWSADQMSSNAGRCSESLPHTRRPDAAGAGVSADQGVNEESNVSQLADHLIDPGSNGQPTHWCNTASGQPADKLSSLSERHPTTSTIGSLPHNRLPELAGAGAQAVDQESLVRQKADHLTDLGSNDHPTHGCKTDQRRNSRSANKLLSYAERRRTSLLSDSLPKDGHPDGPGAGLPAIPALFEEPRSTQGLDHSRTLGNSGQSTIGPDTEKHRTSCSAGKLPSSEKRRTSLLRESRPTSGHPRASRSPNKLSSYAAERRVSLVNDTLGSSQSLNRQDPCTTVGAAPSGEDLQRSMPRHPSLAWAGEPSSHISPPQHGADHGVPQRHEALGAAHDPGYSSALASAARRASELKDELEYRRSSLQRRSSRTGSRHPLSVVGGLLQELQAARQLAASLAEVAAQCQGAQGQASEDGHAWRKLQRSVQSLEQEASAVQRDIAGAFVKARPRGLGVLGSSAADAGRYSDQDEQPLLAVSDMSRRRTSQRSASDDHPHHGSKARDAWTERPDENHQLQLLRGADICSCSPQELLSWYFHAAPDMHRAASEQGLAEISEALCRLATFEDRYQQLLRKLEEQQLADDASSEGRQLESQCLLDRLEEELRDGMAGCEEMMQRAADSRESAPHLWQQLEGRWRQLQDNLRKQRAFLPDLNAAALHEDNDMSMSLAAALHRVAKFEHDLEQQRVRLQQAKERMTGSQAAMSVLELQELLLSLQHLEQESGKGLLECQPTLHAARMEMERIWHELSSLWKSLQSALATLRAEAEGLLEAAGSKVASSGERAPELSGQSREHAGRDAEAQSSAKQRTSGDWKSTDFGVDCRAALAEAKRRVAVFSEDVDQQKMLLKQKRLLRGRQEKLKSLAEERCELHGLLVSHVRNLAEQEQVLEQSFEADDQDVTEIESWQQLIGLAQLQEARDSLQLKLRVAPPGVSAEELSAAQAQCLAVKDRLAELHAEEAEIQHQRMKRRIASRLGAPKDGVTGAPQSLQEAVEDAPVRARAVLSEASECLNSIATGSVNTGDLQERLQRSKKELQVLSEPLVEMRAELEEQQAPKASSVLQKAPAVRDVTKVQAEMSRAVETITERLGWVGSASHDLLAALQKLFENHTGADLEKEVMTAVDSWLRQLPADSAEAGAAEDFVAASAAATASVQSAEAKQILEYLAGAAREAASGSEGRTSEATEDFGPQRAAILETWRRRVAGVAEEDEREAMRQREAMRRKASERRQQRRRKKEQRARRWTAPREAVQVSRLEVRRRSHDGESVARALLRQCDEEAEQQARILLQKAEARRSRLGSRTPVSSPSGGAPGELWHSRSDWSNEVGAGSSNGFNRGLTSASLTGSAWAWAHSRHSADACVESGHDWPASDS